MSNFPRLTELEARPLWDRAVPAKWNNSLFRKVMFDWPTGKRTIYHPNPPAFYSIADEAGTVDEQDYLRLQTELIERAQRRSSIGQSRNMGLKPSPLSFDPDPVDDAEIISSINKVMLEAHLLVIRQEQILRCSFIGRLPESMRTGIGTLAANIHPEMATASKLYQRKGKKVRRARIDIGFGHPTECDRIDGVIELKALRCFGADWFRADIERAESTLRAVMLSGLAGDFQKLLDPRLPVDAFRFSWVVARIRTRVSTERIAEWAQALLSPVKERWNLRAYDQVLDPNTGWLCWRWPNGVALHLAWFWPQYELPDKLESVWKAL